MMNGFVVKAKLPSLNDYILACRTNKYAGNKFKHEVEEVIGWGIKQAISAGTLRRTEDLNIVHFVWHEKTKRRDPDNIVSAKKYILDAMQTFKVIPNDNRKYVKGFTDLIVDDTEDFVEVELEAVK
jgi:Holliday junction resolvase RusA-like endonuclease